MKHLHTKVVCEKKITEYTDAFHHFFKKWKTNSFKSAAIGGASVSDPVALN